jgi:nicotinamidase-related amidase
MGPLPAAGRTVCLIVDMQEKLVPAVADGDRVIDRCGRLIDGARRLGWPVLATEHAADRIGPTVAPLIARLAPAERVPKRHFYAFAEPGFADRLAAVAAAARGGGGTAAPGPAGPPTLLLAGTEAHVCVALTAASALARGYPVAVVADGVGSRDPANRALALTQLQALGAAVWPLETLLFAGLGQADHPAFRDILGLIRPLGPTPGADRGAI